MTSKDVSEAMGFGPEAVGSRMPTYEYGRALCEAAAQDVATFLQNRRRVSQAEGAEGMTNEDLRKIDEELRQVYSPRPLPPGEHLDTEILRRITADTIVKGNPAADEPQGEIQEQKP